MIAQVDNYLNTLKFSEQIMDWRCNPGYGSVEYTVEFPPRSSVDLKRFATELISKNKAFNFSRYLDSGSVVLKFQINL
jgi:hypothetical protein